MTIALIADIHGNLTALDAVVSDATALGARSFWFLGDYCAIGPEPAAVLDRIHGLPGAKFIRGNTDRYIVTGERPAPHLHEVETDPQLIQLFAGITASTAWTQGYLTAKGRLGWLAALPLEMRFTTAERVRILAVHAAPGTDDGEGVHPGKGNGELDALLQGSAADLILVGHTHEPMARRVGNAWVLNPGSIGNPHGMDPEASYALMESTPTGVSVRHRRIPYDLDVFAKAVRRSRHPSADYILSHLKGARPGRPPHEDHTPWPPDEEVHIRPDLIARPVRGDGSRR